MYVTKLKKEIQWKRRLICPLCCHLNLPLTIYRNIDGNHVTCFIQCHCINLVISITKSLELNLPFAFTAKIILDLCKTLLFFLYFIVNMKVYTCISVVLVQLIIQWTQYSEKERERSITLPPRELCKQDMEPRWRSLV